MNFKMITITTIACYILSHFAFFQKTFFWNINTVLYVLPLFCIGFMFRQHEWEQKKIETLFMISFIITAGTIILSLGGILSYQLDIKHSMYTNLLLDLLIPVSFTLMVIFISKVLVYNIIGRIFACIGRETLAIMYLHIPISYILLQHFEFGSILGIRVVLSVMIPIVISKLLIKKISVVKFFFLGP